MLQTPCCQDSHIQIFKGEHLQTNRYQDNLLNQEEYHCHFPNFESLSERMQLQALRV